ncbi:hypothetical protein LguiA_017165 [Lonicera macranthoides]
MLQTERFYTESTSKRTKFRRNYSVSCSMSMLKKEVWIWMENKQDPEYEEMVVDRLVGYEALMADNSPPDYTRNAQIECAIATHTNKLLRLVARAEKTCFKELNNQAFQAFMRENNLSCSLFGKEYTFEGPINEMINELSEKFNECRNKVNNYTETLRELIHVPGPRIEEFEVFFGACMRCGSADEPRYARPCDHHVWCQACYQSNVDNRHLQCIFCNRNIDSFKHYP